MTADKPLLGRYGRVHLVGVGGIGMAGLAQVLAGMGCRVSGSDQVAADILQDLAAAGISVESPHRATAVDGADIVVYSAAVPADNAERVRARDLGIPAVKRAELVGELTRLRAAVGVAGSHGKTTTAAMVAAVLERGGKAPALLIGGQCGGRVMGRWTAGGWMVVEADEYDQGFLHIHPRIALVTNVDAEHLECFGGMEGVRAAFGAYLDRVPFYGHRLVCRDDVGGQALAAASGGCLTYGMGSGGDFEGAWSAAEGLEVKAGGRCLGRVQLGVPGRHNALNALGAAAVGHLMGLGFDAIGAGLEGFTGVQRRLETLGEAGGIKVVDDYAHHPAEIEASLAALATAGRRLVAVFQPHLYSRTRDMGAEFAQVLQRADQVVVTPIYPSREAPIPGVDAGHIVERMRQAGFAKVEYRAGREEVADWLLDQTGAGDLVAFMGAGDIDRFSRHFLAVLHRRETGDKGI